MAFKLVLRIVIIVYRARYRAIVVGTSMSDVCIAGSGRRRPKR